MKVSFSALVPSAMRCSCYYVAIFMESDWTVGERPNRLINEKSPYLLQHATNPVDWYPWGEEALEKARREDKPIFLSIGYSTCHWCHVMEEESFSDPDVAALMNDAFVSIKVDREERPDLDNLYMTVCHMLTGSGGWPLNIIMTPDKKPFFAGTYFPKESRFGRKGMLEIIRYIKNVWANSRSDVLKAVNQISDALQTASRHTPGEDLTKVDLDAAYQALEENFDEVYGGFGRAPKFPTPHNIYFLLRYWKRTGKERALRMAEKTLQSMRRGGIFDQVGFGFHRYSVDREWLVPHFEKMLYDQALLAIAYLEAYQATGKEEYGRTAKEIFEYVLRDMTSPEGGFYSAEDADSEGEEGKFYLWTREEIEETLGKRDAELAIKFFGVEEGGNFQAEGKAGANILHLKAPLADMAPVFGMSAQGLERRIEGIRQKLLAAREKRVRPHRDDKTLADWNGLMIAAFARGAQVFDESRYAEAATRAADFILKNMRGPNGRLFHRYRNGESSISGCIDDYAFMIQGLIDLYEATLKAGYLQAAREFSRVVLKQFWDDKEGGFYFTPGDWEELPVRRKEVYDGAAPAGNSVMMLNLLRLARITADSGLEEYAARIGRAFSQTVRESPANFTLMMVALDYAIGPSYEVVIVGDPKAKDTGEMLRAIRSRFIPNKVVLLKSTKAGAPLIDWLGRFASINRRATAYVCTNYSCERPTTDLDELLKNLGVAVS